ncbi:MAG: hypothetical protein CL677_06355 [Bdellovibrionaceae bacterium]|nr:hypothetical protein [Pseudobdellovibrionaceae bacterium]|tara:strand:- start:63833 stop:64072 length:240 start_codon:yes stop_codon:yes gene_type:complete
MIKKRNGVNDVDDSSPTFFDKTIAWYTSEEAAEYLRTTPKQIRNWVYEGKIRAYRLLGRRLRFKKKDLDSLLVLQGGFL